MKKLIAALALSAVAAPAALAASNSIKVSPSNPTAGKLVTVSGTVKGCKGPVTIYSRAFSSKHKFGGFPSYTATVSNGKFSKKARTKTTASGNYKVSGSCGGHKFGSASMNVQGFY